MSLLNEGGWDRLLRVGVGVALLVGGLMLWSGALATGAIVLGALATLTGIVGWCPAYTLVGWSTRPVKHGGRL
jgi:hypothetical protein